MSSIVLILTSRQLIIPNFYKNPKEAVIADSKKNTNNIFEIEEN